jgi:hypothetical protein
MSFPNFKWGVDVSWLWKKRHKINTLALQKVKYARSLVGKGGTLVILGGM